MKAESSHKRKENKTKQINKGKQKCEMCMQGQHKLMGNYFQLT
jgi:hypothetical protein